MYSLDGATAFKKKSSVEICPQIYTPGSKNMEKYIQSLRDKCRCGVTVVFGKFQDIVSLFVAAYRKKYKGEWVVGDSLLGSIDDVIREMIITHGLSKREVHQVLRGMCSLNGKGRS